MVTESQQPTHSSIHVAPLLFNKDRSLASSSASAHRTNVSSRASHRTQDSSSSHEHSQMTPPATPNGSQEDLHQHIEPPQPVFHSFLRAFYPFHPTYAVSNTTVTLPLNDGDVILVHSIHTNGWADGTLLLSGARGWLPTNYCTGYSPEAMQNLLTAILNFWDVLRSGYVSDSEIFGNQEFMRGIIAGVRYLLVSIERGLQHSAADTIRKNRNAFRVIHISFNQMRDCGGIERHSCLTCLRWSRRARSCRNGQQPPFQKQTRSMARLMR